MWAPWGWVCDFLRPGLMRFWITSSNTRNTLYRRQPVLLIRLITLQRLLGRLFRWECCTRPFAQTSHAKVHEDHLGEFLRHNSHWRALPSVCATTGMHRKTLHRIAHNTVENARHLLLLFLCILGWKERGPQTGVLAATGHRSFSSLKQKHRMVLF